MGKHLIGLPSARFVRVRCPNCKHSFLIDNGKEYDRHEYLYYPKKDKGTCPLCCKEYDIDTKLPIFGLVVN